MTDHERVIQKIGQALVGEDREVVIRAFAAYSRVLCIKFGFPLQSFVKLLTTNIPCLSG